MWNLAHNNIYKQMCMFTYNMQERKQENIAQYKGMEKRLNTGDGQQL